jgi:hypothetical protein
MFGLLDTDTESLPGCAVAIMIAGVMAYAI